MILKAWAIPYVYGLEAYAIKGDVKANPNSKIGSQKASNFLQINPMLIYYPGRVLKICDF
ncbi:MAG: hypothetical protein CM1200mP1_13470 [Candidatus Neomarinimicrobiota bacterium]|nr:MAG: hypothetical protein CM1200mP1_13470 [Candidatus Neomarinimicrobiota bacterium]